VSVFILNKNIYTYRIKEIIYLTYARVEEARYKRKERLKY